MKNSYSEEERMRIILETTSQIVHKHYCENDSEFIIDRFDDDITWQGAGENETAQGFETLADIFRGFQGKVPECEIENEEYNVQKIVSGAYLCTGRMWISTKPETGISLRAHQRITAVYRWIGEEPKCCHLHSSNPYDDMKDGDVGFPIKISNQSYQYLKEQVELQKKQLEEQTEILKRLSYEDALTGVYNRNKFIEVLNEAYNEKYPHLGVAYFDLNGLKTVNDLHGHSAGDELICNVASHLWSAFENKVYRTGGDEFVIVDADLDKDEFIRTVENVEQSMKDDGISFSTGISWRDNNWNMEEQFEEADKLMYQEKRDFYRKRNISRKIMIGNQ